MGFITAKAGLAMAKGMIRIAKKEECFIISDKMVTKAIENTTPIILLLVAHDGMI